jgi:hypothetical protein
VCVEKKEENKRAKIKYAALKEKSNKQARRAILTHQYNNDFEMCGFKESRLYSVEAENLFLLSFVVLLWK